MLACGSHGVIVCLALPQKQMACSQRLGVIWVHSPPRLGVTGDWIKTRHSEKEKSVSMRQEIPFSKWQIVFFFSPVRSRFPESPFLIFALPEPFAHS